MVGNRNPREKRGAEGGGFSQDAKIPPTEDRDVEKVFHHYRGI